MTQQHDWEQYNLTDAEREHFRQLRAEHHQALRIAATRAALEEWASIEAESWCCNGESEACTTQGSCGQRE